MGLSPRNVGYVLLLQIPVISQLVAAGADNEFQWRREIGDLSRRIPFLSLSAFDDRAARDRGCGRGVSFADRRLDVAGVARTGNRRRPVDLAVDRAAVFCRLGEPVDDGGSDVLLHFLGGASARVRAAAGTLGGAPRARRHRVPGLTVLPSPSVERIGGAFGCSLAVGVSATLWLNSQSR